MKTKEELNALKAEVETVNKKLAELSENELEEVVGGGFKEWLEREIKKGEDYYSNTKGPVNPGPVNPILPGVLPEIE